MLKVACPSCAVGLKVAATLPVGKAIKCPKCGAVFPARAGNGQPTSSKGSDLDLRKRPPRPVEDKDLDEEVEERPVVRKKRRRKKKRASNSWLLVSLAIGGVLLLGIGITVAAVFWSSRKKIDVMTDNGRPQSGAAASVGPSGSVQGEEFALGKSLFAQNCTRCHSIGGGDVAPRGRSRGPDLTHVGRDPNHTVEWLLTQIRNPKAHNSDSRMPSYEGKLKDDELRALVEYLASLK